MENELVQSVHDIGKLARQGFDDWASLGDVVVKRKGELLLFSYTAQAQFANRWNVFERVSRGLIINGRTGEIVARPFDKFFNWGEGGRTTTAPLSYVMEKMDGSLGISYCHEGQYYVATRGSFDGHQAQWATQRLRWHIANLERELPDSVTLLFEIIYPENRVVVDYQGLASLVLLAVRERESGAYWSWSEVRALADAFNFGLPHVYHSMYAPEAILEAAERLSVNEEGFVAVFGDGERFKFKGQAYKDLHRVVMGLSYRRAVETCANGLVDNVREIVPIELRGQWEIWVKEIQEEVAGLLDRVEAGFALAPKDDRKSYALYVQATCPELATYMFARLDGRPVEELIYRRAFQDRIRQQETNKLRLAEDQPREEVAA